MDPTAVDPGAVSADPGPCPVCGLDPRTVKPPDASAALRSYPRRYRRLLARVDDDEGARVVTERPAPGRWSALEHGAHVADVLGTVEEAVGRIHVHDEPSVEIGVGPPRAGPVDEVLGRIRTASDLLAARVDGIQGRDWQRRGRLATGRPVSAMDLSRHAVHVGTHHLRVVESVTAAVLLGPGSAGDRATD